MLSEFLITNRLILIARCREKIVARFESAESAPAMNYGVPLFLQQLVETLQAEQETDLREATDAQPTPAETAIVRAAGLHGTDLLRRGFTVDQVVHDYGDVCQSVTALAVEHDSVISVDEFRTLDRCLDNAIAEAVASFGAARVASMERQADGLRQRLIAYFAEHRRLMDMAMKSLAAIKTGSIGISGTTGTLLTRTLDELFSLTDRALPELVAASPGTGGVSA
jgi:hypothetical protein